MDATPTAVPSETEEGSSLSSAAAEPSSPEAGDMRDSGTASPSVPPRWRRALVGYVPAVRRTNQRLLGSARNHFALYLVALHKKLHPLFADDVLTALASLPATDPRNDRALVTRVEIVLAGNSGGILKMGVVRSSGIMSFDMNALESVDHAAPFGPAPTDIRSSDGNVYFSWEFHRDPVFACSTINARPYLLDLAVTVGRGDGGGQASP